MKGNKLYNPAFMAPALIIYIVIYIIPVVSGFYYSMTDWNMYSKIPNFVGLKNFIEIFQSGSNYLKYIGHTFVFAFFTVILKSGFGLMLAILLNMKIRSRNALRTVFFMPYTLAPLIIGMVFISILAPNGPLNQFLDVVGLEGLSRAWLVDKDVVLGSTMVVEVWRMTGWNMAIFLAGMQMIPESFYDAASIDGANKWKQFTKITIPFLMPAITITTVLNTIHGLRVFEIIYVLTNGGPGDLTQVLNIVIFKEFSRGRYGMSTALGVVVTIITTVIALSFKKTLSSKEVQM